MTKAANSCPLTAQQTVDVYFMEHRAKALDIAAFLDRVERSQTSAPGSQDFRVEAMKRALAVLIDGKGDRTRRMLELWSDPTAEPIPTATTKGASGAYQPK